MSELPELFDEREIAVVRLFEEGGTYRSVAAELGISPETIRLMIRGEKASAAFQAHYARARAEQGHEFADEIIDTLRNPTLDSADKRARIDALKWAAGKRMPKVYGDKITQEHTGADGAPLTVQIKKFDV